MNLDERENFVSKISLGYHPRCPTQYFIWNHAALIYLSVSATSINESYETLTFIASMININLTGLLQGGGSALMSRRSDAMKIEASNDENVIYCKTVSTSFSRKKKKNKEWISTISRLYFFSPKTVEFFNHRKLMRFNQGGSSGGENVDCSGLDLVHLDDIITDMRIGNFIRVRTNGQPRNIKLTDITGMNLADNKLTDGDNLKEFLSYLPRNRSHLSGGYTLSIYQHIIKFIFLLFRYSNFDNYPPFGS